MNASQKKACAAQLREEISSGTLRPEVELAYQVAVEELDRTAPRSITLTAEEATFVYNLMTNVVPPQKRREFCAENGLEFGFYRDLYTKLSYS